MNDDTPDPVPKAAPSGSNQPSPGKDDRRAAALKANMARRKAQARAKAGGGDANQEQEQQ